MAVLAQICADLSSDWCVCEYSASDRAGAWEENAGDHVFCLKEGKKYYLQSILVLTEAVK